MEHPALRTVALPVLLPAHRRARQDAVIGHGLHSVRASGAIEIDARLLWPVRSIPIPRGNLRLLVREYVEHYNQLLQRAPPPARSPTHVRRRECVGETPHLLLSPRSVRAGRLSAPYGITSKRVVQHRSPRRQPQSTTIVTPGFVGSRRNGRASVRRCCTNRHWPARCQPTGFLPADAIRRWSAEGGHPIQDLTAEDDLTPLPSWPPGPEASADDGLVAEERVLHPALTMVP